MKIIISDHSITQDQKVIQLFDTNKLIATIIPTDKEITVIYKRC